MQPAPSRRKRRYLGMTASQIGILSGMAVLNFIVLGVGLALVIGRSAPTGSQAIAPDRLIAQTTPAATTAPTRAPATDVPIEPGWTLYERPLDGFAIALPSTWAQIDPDAESLGTALASVRARLNFPDMQTPYFLQGVNVEDLRALGMRFIAFEARPDDGSVVQVPSVIVIRYPLTEETTLDAVIDSIVSEGETREAGRVEYRRVNLSVGEAAEFTFPEREEMTGIALRQYAVVDRSRAFLIQLGSEVSQVVRNTPVLDRVLQSFRWREVEAAPYPGWQRHTGRGVRVWLPGSWHAVSTRFSEEELEALVEDASALGPEWERIMEAVKQDPDAFVLFAVDGEMGDSGLLTNLVVTRVDYAGSVDQFMDELIRLFPKELVLVSRDVTLVNAHETGKMLIEMVDPQNGTVRGKEVSYAVKVGDVHWIVTYFTGVEEFDKRFPVFEQSIHTLEILP